MVVQWERPRADNLSTELPYWYTSRVYKKYCHFRQIHIEYPTSQQLSYNRKRTHDPSNVLVISSTSPTALVQKVVQLLDKSKKIYCFLPLNQPSTQTSFQQNIPRPKPVQNYLFGQKYFTITYSILANTYFN